MGNWSNMVRRNARKTILAPGQGAQKSKTHRKRRSRGSQRHKRALRVPQTEEVAPD